MAVRQHPSSYDFPIFNTYIYIYISFTHMHTDDAGESGEYDFREDEEIGAAPTLREDLGALQMKE